MSQIVVGFDGSEAAHEAIGWAAGEAERSGESVLVIQSWSDPILYASALTDGWADPGAAERAVRVEMEAAVSKTSDRHPRVSFSSSLVPVAPAAALIDASDGASMVVVGSRGRGGFASLLLGSVALRVASAASSTVVIVRRPGPRDGCIVVGVDGSPSSRQALAWAAEVARGRGCPLRVVLAWGFFSPQGPDGAEPIRADYTEVDAWKALGTIVDEVLGADPGITIDLQAVCDLPAKALLSEAGDASLLVVGPRGWTKTSPLDLGSAATQILHHAPCPLAIVR